MMSKIVFGRASGFENRESRNLSFLAKPAKELPQRGRGVSLSIVCILLRELGEKTSICRTVLGHPYNPTIL